MKRFNGLVVRVLFGQVSHYDSGTLDPRRLEEAWRTIEKGREGVVGDSVVSDEGSREDENLGSVRRVRHGFRVGRDRRAEDGFSETTIGRAEGLAGEGLPGLEMESRVLVGILGSRNVICDGREGSKGGKTEGRRDTGSED